MSVIALPLDGSKCAEAALPHALAQLNAEDELVLIRIVQPPATGTTLDWLKTQKYLAQLYLDEKKYQFELSVAKVTTVVRAGSPGREMHACPNQRKLEAIRLKYPYQKLSQSN